MDLVSRDLRRSGYWGNAIKGTTITGSGTSTMANPYRGVSSADDAVTYQFSRDTTEDDDVADSEKFGFQLEDGVLKMQTDESTAYAAMTDPNQVTVTEFSITSEPTDIALGSLCTTVCAVGTPNCPTMTVRRFVIRLSGQSVTDTSVVRTLEASVRPRNDQLEGQCPA
jgi:hypothetical protein